MRTLTPVLLGFLLKVYYVPNYGLDDSNLVPHIVDRIPDLVSGGVLVYTNDVCELTDKGKTWIKDILETPVPVQKWVSGRAA